MTFNHQALSLCLRALIPQTGVGHSAPGSSLQTQLFTTPSPLEWGLFWVKSFVSGELIHGHSDTYITAILY